MVMLKYNINKQSITSNEKHTELAKQLQFFFFFSQLTESHGHETVIKILIELGF